MTNHVHLLASTARPYGLSLMMRYVGRFFVRYINRAYRRSGTCFLRCCSYIECNPVRARMVRGPGEYLWSSYRSHAVGVPDGLLAVHDQYQRLGQSGEERQRAYRDLFRAELDTGELAEIRDTANRGWPLGSDRFKHEIERALRCAVHPPKRGRPSTRKTPAPIAEERRPRYRIEKLH